MKPSLRLLPRRPVSNIEIQAYAKELAPQIEKDERAEWHREAWEAVWTLLVFLAALTVLHAAFGGAL